MTWLLGTRVGRAIAGAVALLLAIVTFGAWQRREGAEKEKNKGLRNRLKTGDTARKVQDGVNQIDDPDLPDHLAKWLRDRK